MPLFSLGFFSSLGGGGVGIKEMSKRKEVTGKRGNVTFKVFFNFHGSPPIIPEVDSPFLPNLCEDVREEKRLRCGGYLNCLGGHEEEYL